MLTRTKKPKQRWLDLAPGDTVVVIAGKDRGKQGEVLRTLPGRSKIVVRGVNVQKRHAKAGQSAGGTKAIQGGVIDFEAPLSYSNVMLVCPHCNEPTRVKHTVLDNGAKALLCRNCNEPYERIKKAELQ
ncbi:MAG TPA: 50S ribosomal protein L24 [Candidatus Dormibacteraeota bacterium]|nr:50S ribosomal protein L24 [Candidatus Dormibacteraeota bacterium]